MIEQISEEEIEIGELLCDPIALAESLFSDFENLSKFDEDQLGHIRLGQLPLMSYEYLLDYDPKLSSKENFKLREGAGTIYALGARKWGKTHFVEMVDILLSMVLLEGEHVGFTSLDAIHIRGILEKVIQVCETHPFFDEVLSPQINRSPSYRIYLKNGYTLDGINMNLSSKEPGAQFFQKHMSRLYIEEASFESEVVYKKRLDAVAENGCIVRSAGMTNFTKYSPCGRIFYDLPKRAWLCNLPQYVNPKWDIKEKEKAKKEHGGEESISYRVFVEGEVVEEGISVFDMERVRKCYNDAKTIKHFEVTKETFNFFESIIIVDQMKQAETTWIAADIGETAPTDIMIFFEVEKKYQYAYNITLYNLTDKQQEQIFCFLMSKLKVNFLGLDTTDGTGRAIFRSLAEKYPKENLVWVGFNEKIKVDFDKDEYGNIIFKDGQPTHKEEYVADWSIKRLKELFYEERLVLPLDYRLDKQLNSVVSSMTGTRTVYECISDEDHLLAAMRVFSIAQWALEFTIVKPLNTKKFSKSGV